MARPDQHSRDRLAAVLDPWPGDGDRPFGDLGLGDDGPAADAPTQPLPLIPPPGRRPGRIATPTARWLPAGWRGARLDPGRPGALALLLTAAVAAVLAAVGVWWEAPRAEPVPSLPALVEAAPTASTAAPPGSAAMAAPASPLVVAVAGRVVRPGLVQVPAGARVADVLAAAGGPLPGTDLAGVNLARRVADGEQVAVGVPGATDAAAPPAAASGAGPTAPGTPLDLNAATVEQLDALPGIGPVTAQRIVDWRGRNGRFATVDQLREVDGIGERRLGQLRELVRV